jgi:hypothetical protein
MNSKILNLMVIFMAIFLSQHVMGNRILSFEDPLDDTVEFEVMRRRNLFGARPLGGDLGGEMHPKNTEMPTLGGELGGNLEENLGADLGEIHTGNTAITPVGEEEAKTDTMHMDRRNLEFRPLNFGGADELHARRRDLEIPSLGENKFDVMRRRNLEIRDPSFGDGVEVMRRRDLENPRFDDGVEVMRRRNLENLRFDDGVEVMRRRNFAMQPYGGASGDLFTSQILSQGPNPAWLNPNSFYGERIDGDNFDMNVMRRRNFEIPTFDKADVVNAMRRRNFEIPTFGKADVVNAMRRRNIEIPEQAAESRRTLTQKLTDQFKEFWNRSADKMNMFR